MLIEWDKDKVNIDNLTTLSMKKLPASATNPSVDTEPQLRTFF